MIDRLPFVRALGCAMLLGAVHANAQATPNVDWPVEKVSEGHAFLEGPAVSPAGTVYFSDIPDNEIWVFDPTTGETTLFQNDSNASNGLWFDAQGQLIACQGSGPRNLAIYSDWQDASSRQDLVVDLAGKHFNSPNDVVLFGNHLAFTDPRYGNRDSMELDHESVYVCTYANGQAGEPVRLNHTFVRPNGIIASPDGKHVYIADNGSAELFVWDTSEPADQANVKILTIVDKQRGGMDGMCVDAKGNIYATCPGLGAVSIISPEGKELARVPIPEGPANCTLSKDGNVLYVTARTSLYAVQVGELP